MATRSTGELITAVTWNKVENPMSCRAYNNANISVADITVQALTLNSERFDVGLHDTGSNTSRMTVPTGYDGLYLITGNVAFAANGTGDFRIAIIRLNGTTEIARHNATPDATGIAIATVTTIYRLAATNYVELCAYQDSGGALNALVLGNYSPELSVAMIGSHA